MSWEINLKQKDSPSGNVKMNKIFLVRHGQDTDNAADTLNGRRDTLLTALGRRQARLVANKLIGHGLQVIYTSPLKRAAETAKIIAKELSINKIVIEKYLTERDFGVLTGKPVHDILKYTNQVLPSDGINYFLEVEGAEDFATLLLRGKKILEKLQRKHPDENILIVTHGDIGKMIRAAYHNWGWQQGLKTPYFNNTGVLELAKKRDIFD